MSLDEYYRKCDEARKVYEGKRAVMTETGREGTTGRFEACEDGIGFRMDQPLPAWTDDYEDARAGFLTLGHEVKGFDLVKEDFPIHSADPELLKPRKV